MVFTNNHGILQITTVFTNVRLFTNAHGYLRMRSYTDIQLLSIYSMRGYLQLCSYLRPNVYKLTVNVCLYACIPINEWPDKKFLANHNIDVDTQYNIDMYGFSIIILRRHSEKRSVAIKW